MIIPKGVIADVRFEVKNGFKNVNDILSQLKNIDGDLYPFIVERKDFCSSNKLLERFSELSDSLGSVSLGYAIHDGSCFNVILNLDLIKTPNVIQNILSYERFSNVLERDLMICAYSLFSNLGYIGGGFKKFKFEDGLLVGKNFSFSVSPNGLRGNHVIAYRPFIGFPELGNFVYKSFISQALNDNFFGRLNNDYEMSLRYFSPVLFADSTVFIDPSGPSDNLITGLGVNKLKPYLLSKIDCLSSVMKIDLY